MTVSVHTLFVDRCTEDDVALAETLLSPAERTKRDKFVFKEHARLYSLAHALVRRTLADHLHVAPHTLEFDENQYGKPSVRGASLDFNLSHTKGLIAVGIAAKGALGVDVECMDRNTDVLMVAQHSFSDAEAADVTATAPAGRKERFFRYWTLKESYIKARGMGLHCPLKAFSFELTEPIGIRMRADLGDTPERWAFEQRRVSKDHFLAICVERDAGVAPSIQIHERTRLL